MSRDGKPGGRSTLGDNNEEFCFKYGTFEVHIGAPKGGAREGEERQARHIHLPFFGAHYLKPLVWINILEGMSGDRGEGQPLNILMDGANKEDQPSALQEGPVRVHVCPGRLVKEELQERSDP